MDPISKEKVQEITELYISQVKIPDKKGPAFILCPVGLVGSGKSTVIQELAKKIGLIRIEADKIRKTLKDMGYNYDSTEDIFLLATQYFLDKGYGIAADADFIRKDKREKTENIASQRNIRVIYIYINPPEEFILNKLRNFKHTWLFRDADQAIENYNARKPLHQNIDIDFTYTFDTSKENISEQIEEAAQRIVESIK